MKILHIITRSDTVGGAQKYILETSRQFLNDGHEVSVMAGGSGVFYNAIDALGANYIEMNTMMREVSFFNDFKTALKIRAKVMDINPDVVLVHSAKAGLLSRLALAFSRFKVIYIAHGWSHIRISSGVTFKTYCLIESVLSRLCKVVVCISKSDFDYAIDKVGISEGKLELIYNGVPEPLVSYAGVSQNDAINMLTITRFQEPKDFETLLSALNMVRDYPWFLNVLGDGETLAYYKAQVVELELSHKIRFLGFKKELGSYYEECDVVILISKSEGLPLALLEAMSYRKFLVASSVGGIPELIDDEYNGYLIPDRDYEYLADRFRVIFGLSKEELLARGECSYLKYKESFNIEKTISKLYEAMF
ncbi:glycosyltransferase family 4 protein [Vibrio vulnificus]|uniref:glycosyltransferase family 4 protein n=1 Tax=Vibrio vulnificus TaxID=672 RepID=UPI0024E012E5|nr:glycosyltransferase family 4 protein [Vibrio vulnificus]MDK2678972.1 glycosyltransferase family 4 protein [Vibrio vulnificus]MDK2687745.1 glycosyltransferase family 4 protein [Vibrio vulnificus]